MTRTHAVLMTETLLDHFIQLIGTLTGMDPPVSHRHHIRRELERTLAFGQIDPQTFYTRAAQGEPDIRQSLLNIATINETYFFREERHFAILQSEVLPRLFQNRDQILIWSATCSTGEEAVSLAILAQEEKKRHPGKDFHLIASDINDLVLEHLKKGSFSRQSFRKDGSRFYPLLKGHGTFSGNSSKDYYRPADTLLAKITAVKTNLYTDSYSFLPGMADLVFFRNTLTYMNMENRSGIVQRIADTLAPGGCFFLGSSEVSFVRTNSLESVESAGTYYFRRKVIPGTQTGSKAVQDPPYTTRADTKQQATDIAPQLSEIPGGDISADPDIRSAAVQIRQCLEEINASDFLSARNTLQRIGLRQEQSALPHFLEGLILKGENLPAESAACFMKALGKDPEFWPARFHYAMGLLAADPEKAASHFEYCLTGMESGNPAKGRDYSLFLDGFNQDCYQQICRQWARKLRRTRTPETAGPDEDSAGGTRGGKRGN